VDFCLEALVGIHQQVDDPTKRRRKDMVAESTADSADVNLTDHEDVGMVSPPVPSIYDIAEKKNKRRSEKEPTPMAPGKKQGTGHAQKDPIPKATASNTSKGKAQSSPPRGLMGALEAAREAAKMREIARPLAPVPWLYMGLLGHEASQPLVG